MGSDLLSRQRLEIEIEIEYWHHPDGLWEKGGVLDQVLASLLTDSGKKRACWSSFCWMDILG